MTLGLSRPSRLLLVRGFFFVLSLAAIYGIWENRMFINDMAFLALTVTDAVFAVLFLYLVVQLPKVITTKRLFVERVLGAAWLFVIVANVIGSIMHATQLGLEKIAANAGYSPMLYIASEALYLVVLPTVAFYIILHLVKNLSHT